MGQVIYLDVDDEITSAVARIRAAAPGPVVLVVPFGSRLASSRINFRLLAREAAALRRDLTIVAPEPPTRALAASAGLATHATVLEYESVAAAASQSRPAGIRDGGSARAAGTPAGAQPSSAAPPPDRLPPAPSAATPPPALAPRSSPPVREAGPADGWSGQEGLRGPVSTGPIPVVGPPRRGFLRRPAVLASLAVIAIVAAVAGLAGFLLLPSAEVTLKPVSEAVGPLALSVTADPQATAPDSTRLVVPASKLSLPVGVTAQFPATSRETIEQKATGSVTFESYDTSSAQSFPAGTVVKTSAGIEFVTSSSVTLQRAKVGPGKTLISSVKSVAVTAVKAGPEANVAAGAITVLPARYDAAILSVSNAAPTTGGARQELIKVARADVDAALAVLRTRLNEAFAAKIAEPGIAPAGSVLVVQTQRLGDATPSADPNALVGLQQATFDLGLSATGTVIAVDPGPVTGVAEARLAASIPDGYSLVPDSTRTTVDPPAASGETVTFAVRVRGERSRQLDVDALAAQIRGKSIAAARTILEPYGEVRISVWPDWVTSIPDSGARVTLTIAGSPGAAGASPAPSAAPTGKPGASPAATQAATVRPSAAVSPARTASPAPSATRRP